MASMICAVHVSRGAPSCHALAGAARSQPTLHRSGEVLLPALSRNTDAAFLVSTLHFPPEQEGYLGYAVIIPTLIFIVHSGRALSHGDLAGVARTSAQAGDQRHRTRSIPARQRTA